VAARQGAADALSASVVAARLPRRESASAERVPGSAVYAKIVRSVSKTTSRRS
jgi:hypothetical protein